ncbi:alcohol dehydrogenase AdhP [Rhizobium sp. WW22]|uniref:alcohol dehydrogenase AdhP n=1 Tax=unclassified Rhizobium TaxID=2613769 RepID=UPI000DD64513|nr:MULTISPECIES: alcohol dehydrogenase AdhP [unclassified Rhizobium]MBB3384329.1 propanol-preferring alcohol dehydrogenase [Rhizobium sp. BK098]MBB3616311.1 propanol-preferring alcohol dehydrogenase [Rhizobium sp. BK609]MBB3681970.1 propanol-preferring alcohol dehydrogenase [Rhizobium sp. BK612]
MIAKTMMAAVVRQFGEPLAIESVPVPVPGPGELLIKVIACGVCHTDLHAADGDWPVKPSPPFIPGHEVAGVVAALGPGVTDFREGDPVGIAWLHDACMRCEYCETGWETLCEHQHDTGYSCDGGFAEYVIASAAFTARLPVNVDFAQIAPILCAGVTTYKGLKETEARPGEWVAISGIGGLGHVAIQYAKAMGLKIVALDVTPEKLALALATGADVAIDARSPDAIADVLKATNGGAHGILVTAVSPPAFSQALHMVRRKGTVALVGLPPGEFPTPIFDVVLKRITLRGSIVGTRRDLDEAIAFAVDGNVKAEITKAPLSDINTIFAKLKAGKIEGRMVLDFTMPITTAKPGADGKLFQV